MDFTTGQYRNGLYQRFLTAPYNGKHPKTGIHALQPSDSKPVKNHFLVFSTVYVPGDGLVRPGNGTQENGLFHWFSPPRSGSGPLWTLPPDSTGLDFTTGEYHLAPAPHNHIRVME